jgi:hypothetical protein
MFWARTFHSSPCAVDAVPQRAVVTDQRFRDRAQGTPRRAVVSGTPAYGRPVDDQAGTPADRPLSVRLDLYLDRQPISGRLRTEWGADEEFVGWLGFVEALERLLERRQRLADPRAD